MQGRGRVTREELLQVLEGDGGGGEGHLDWVGLSLSLPLGLLYCAGRDAVGHMRPSWKPGKSVL